MMVGAVGVLVTTLILKFGASWVFLYPLSFHGAGAWGKWTTAVCSGSMLLAGLSIVVWCLSILHTVIGPALGARSSNPLNRIGYSFGLGYLWPKKFPTVEGSQGVPYAAIPLAVIAFDMIIATLPLALLLVQNIVQAFAPSVTVNLLIAGKLIAVAWAIAVVANVLVWAHHIYVDYPGNSIQGALNIAMQPMTFTLTIPSALSLYSLAFTIYRSNYKWNAVGTTMFLAIVSWFLAGLSGVVNATIRFDEVVHNTL